jgi:dipeptidase E
MTRKLLLISNSTLHGSGYLDHCAEEITNFLGNRTSILFIPYARPSGMTYDEYTKLNSARFEKMGYKLISIHQHDDPKTAVQFAEAIFIGGGNTFVLLEKLYKEDIISDIRKQVDGGTPYIGSSAGANVACPNMKTTNDMPIIYPPSFNALDLVPFNINPHYLDPDPNSTHMGETRETRINEFHCYNSEYVVGLREGAMLHVVNQNITLKGTTGARIFNNQDKAEEYKPGDKLDFLLEDE